MRTCILGFMAFVAIALQAAAGSASALSAPGPNDATVPAQIALRVGEQPYRFGGEAICQHAPQASIHEAPAALWSARHTEAGRSLNLSFWRVKGHGDMLTLALTLSGASHQVDTVRIGQKGETAGSGRVTFTASGNGGTFTIDAVAKDGTPITGTISCGRFTPIVEEGGGD
jgi:hypothetical protein